MGMMAPEDPLAALLGGATPAPAGPDMASLLGEPSDDELDQEFGITEENEADALKEMLETARALLSGGTLSEQSKLLVEKANTLLQQV
jgi:hypothetical protein